jgi:hypothetical protein
MERVEHKVERRIEKQRKWFESAKENGNQA